MDKKLSELYEKGLSRRNFLIGAGAVGASSALAGCSNNSPATTAPTSASYTDVDILNFALNLEYLEAEFYLRAATGSGLATADIGTNPGAVTGGAKVPTTSTTQQNILNEIAYDEQQHVRFLRSALGTSAVARPVIDLTTSFNTLANAATIAPTFNPFSSFDNFLVGAFIFEDVGVTAYHGAAGLISAAGITAGYLTAAAGIMAVEAYHAAYVRTAITANAINLGIANYPQYGYAQKVTTLRATLGGANETTLSGANTAASTLANVGISAIVAADTTNAIAFSRSTDQVLRIVYGAVSPVMGATTAAAGVKSGLFFPSGLNGNITATQS